MKSLRRNSLKTRCPTEASPADSLGVSNLYGAYDKTFQNFAQVKAWFCYFMPEKYHPIVLGYTRLHLFTWMKNIGNYK